MTLEPAKLKPYLVLLVILLLAFLPVSSFYFAMKNDAFSDNFPNKFFFTESIHSGFLPLWNPYLNFGFPVYADPGFAFWNPITWFFGAIVGYNAYTLTAEVLLYIYIAGITMYHLGRYFNFTSHIAIAVACMYMCSGFFTGELQHINFLTAAAFLPFLLQQFLVLFENPNYKNACLSSIALYMVFAAGHPAIAIGAIYFLITLYIAISILNRASRQNWKVISQYHLLSIFIFSLLYSPAIYSYLNILPHYGRGGSLNQFNETAYGFSPSSYLSFVYPFATVKDAKFFTDDLSMRNAFFSLTGFVFLLTQLKNKNYLVRLLIVCGLVMLILSTGGYIKGLFYSNLPLLKYIRTNGEFRIFCILCFSIVAGFGLNELKIKPNPLYYQFRKIILVLLSMSLAVFCFALIGSVNNVAKLFTVNIKEPATAIKIFLDNITFQNVILISATIQFIVILFLCKVKTNTRKIAIIIAADLVINSIIYLPFTGVGTVTLSEIQKVYDSNEKGIIVPPLVALKSIDTFSVRIAGLVGSASFYNKKIGITRLTDYPSYFSTTKTFFKSSLADTVNNLPYVFLKKDVVGFLTDPHYSDKSLTVNFFSPQKINIAVSVSEQDSLIFLQNYYKFWKVKVDSRNIPVSNSFITFMSVPLNKGRHSVEFYYEDKGVILFFILSMVTFIAILIAFIRKSYI